MGLFGEGDKALGYFLPSKGPQSLGDSKTALESLAVEVILDGLGLVREMASCDSLVGSVALLLSALLLATLVRHSVGSGS